ncbi:hypothetical protein ABMA28_001912 [Loxostege sticticalis]|uniref:BTB domain-containing protein n=1 Tax=Loxostege sticticalis TaxID=481309 RepID=A0ABD0SZ41_LOXSC
MAQSQFSLTWDEYRRSICNGLSSLQQNGEFVDMTLAADGHLVKVHQVIVALASPYLKELIGSAQCPHPVIFLNKISYTTLCSILEYIYTGEVLVSMDHLNEFIDAGRELHIRGLEDMKLQQQIPKPQQMYQSLQASSNLGEYDEEVCYFEISNQRSEDDQSQLGELETEILPDTYNPDMRADTGDKDNNSILSSSMMYDDEGIIEEEVDLPDNPKTQSSEISQKNPNVSIMQYTVSNQGSLQMILNRFVYYLKHTNANQTRQWRCVDYVTGIKCPAHVVTKADMVLQRINAHTHPFHDKRILKKVRAGSIFSAIQEAEKEGSIKKRKPNPPTDPNADIE